MRRQIRQCLAVFDNSCLRRQISLRLAVLCQLLMCVRDRLKHGLIVLRDGVVQLRLLLAQFGIQLNGVENRQTNRGFDGSVLPTEIQNILQIE